ncbi:MAG: hypothetical protein U0232_20095 [Thermomicrobiales bacterium]
MPRPPNTAQLYPNNTAAPAPHPTANGSTVERRASNVERRATPDRHPLTTDD